ncbi:MAG: RraA family protein [Candidatus Hydrogenedentes bacterium]|nr:RraA family protein [Candidatus Hydrogenedentota bacterium]
MSEIAGCDFILDTALAGGAGIAASLAAPQRAANHTTEESRPMLTDDELNYLRRFDTPTIANGLEQGELPKIHGQSRLEGVMSPKVRCILPELGIVNGYAATATVRASKPRDEKDPYTSTIDYWKYIDSIPKPTIMVIHDLDAPNPVGSWWGEVNANVHQALGCVGVVTDGGVRDLSEVRQLGFHFFAAEVLVSHAYVHVVDFGKPVSVGGLTIESGDLLQGDEHGVIRVPESAAKVIGQACYDVFKSERALIEFCQTPGVTLEKLIEFVSNG